MRHWLTASEIADFKLPDLPGSKKGVLDYAERAGWTRQPGMTRPAQRKGGGLEFRVELLPQSARAALAVKDIGRVTGAKAFAAQAAQEPEAASLTAPAKDQRDARLAIIDAIDRFQRQEAVSATTANTMFIFRYNLGKIEVDAWIRQALPELAARTVARWRAAVKAGTLHRLAVDHGAKRRGKGKLEVPEVRTRMLALMVAQPHLSAKRILDNLQDHFPGLALPSERTVRLAKANLKSSEKVMLAQLTNPDAFNNKFRVSGNNSHQVTRLNELWMIDASPADVLTLDGRQSVYVAIDLYSRRVLIHVTPTPRAAAVGDLMRKALLEWNLCERLKTDNGSDFVAIASKRLFLNLGINVDTSTPFSPWEKGQVERVIRTFQHDCGPLLPGFCGHNVAERKVIEARRAFAKRLGDTDQNAFSVELSAAELQSYVDRWARDVYAHSPHDALRGVTPFAAAAGYVGIRKSVDVRALDVLLQPVAGQDGIRTVHKNGIRIDGSRYHAPTLIGRKVLVRMDRADMGRALLFTEDGTEFLGEAACYELQGVNPAEAIAAARAEQKRVLAERSAEVRAEVKTIKPRDMIDAVLRQAAIRNGTLVEFPRASVAHTTPALEAAAEAARAGDAPPVAAEPSIEDKRAVVVQVETARRETTARAEAGLLGFQAAPEAGVVPLRTRATPAQRYAQASVILDRIAAGAAYVAEEMDWALAYERDPEFIGQLPTAERRFLHVRRLGELEASFGPLWPHEQRWRQGFCLGAEYRSVKQLVEDFGEAALRSPAS